MVVVDRRQRIVEVAAEPAGFEVGLGGAAAGVDHLEVALEGLAALALFLEELALLEVLIFRLERTR